MKTKSALTDRCQSQGSSNQSNLARMDVLMKRTEQHGPQLRRVSRVRHVDRFQQGFRVDLRNFCHGQPMDLCQPVQQFVDRRLRSGIG